MSDLLLERYSVFTILGKITHITTNLAPNSLKERYGELIADRFREMFNVITLLGDSRRK